MRGVFQETPLLQKKLWLRILHKFQNLKKHLPRKENYYDKAYYENSLLLVMAMCQRQQALHLLDVRNIDIKYDCLIVRFGDPLKITGPKFHQDEITSLAYPPDKRLYPINYYKIYLKRTNKYRNHNNDFLIIIRLLVRLQSQHGLEKRYHWRVLIWKYLHLIPLGQLRLQKRQN